MLLRAVAGRSGAFRDDAFEPELAEVLENFTPSRSRCLDKLEPSARSVNPPACRQGLHFLIFRLADKHGRAHASVYYGAQTAKGMTQMLARRLVRAGAGVLATAIIIATAIDVATAQSDHYERT